MARQEQDRPVLAKPETIRQRLHSRFARIPADRRLVDEWLAELRLEAQGEET